MKAGMVCAMVLLPAALVGEAAGVEHGTASAATEPPSRQSVGLEPSTSVLAQVRNLPSIVRAARGDFAPVTERQVDEARTLLESSVLALDNFLDQNPTVRDGWRRYLRLPDLERQLTHGASPDPKQLRQIRERFVGGHPGLEREKLTAVRAALKRYAQVLEDGGSRTLEQDYRTQLELLARTIETYCDAPGQETLRQVVGPLSWLEQRGQADSAVQTVRRVLSRPNLLLQISEKAIAALVYAPIDETEPVRDTILGTHIRGTGRTVGYVTASVVPNDRVAAISVAMIATNSSKTVGYSDPVQIYQDNCTTLRGSKRVVIDGDGIRSLPAVSTVSTQSDLIGLRTTVRGGLMDRAVRRRAYRMFYAQEDAANRIVEGRQRQRFNRRLDDRVDDQVAKGNSQLKQRFFKPLTRYDIFPRQFGTRSTSEQLQVSLQFCSVAQLGAPSDPPALPAATDVAVQAHQSAFDNLASNVLAGRTLTVDDVKAMIGADVAPSEDRADLENDRVTVTLAAVQPVSVRFDDGVVTVSVRGRRYIVRNRSYPPMNVTVRYRLESVDGGMRATRVGEVQIVPPEIARGIRHRYSMRERAFQRLMRNRMDRELKEEYVRDGVTLEGQMSAVGKLSIARLVVEDGWLTLACQQTRSDATRRD